MITSSTVPSNRCPDSLTVKLSTSACFASIISSNWWMIVAASPLVPVQQFAGPNRSAHCRAR
jgi:hypothetical protein